MGPFVFPMLLLLVLVPAPKASAQALADFSRFSKALNAEIALIDREGVVREGTLMAASTDSVTMRFGSGQASFSRDIVASADRLRDGSLDGTIKGAIFGAIIGLISLPYYDGDQQVGAMATAIAIYGGIGWLLDASQTHRAPLYRAPSAPAPTVKLSLRF